MIKNTRSGKQIIRALSLGLGASMLMQPVAAMADEVEDEASLLPATEDSPMDYTEATGETKDALDDAVLTEAATDVKAVLTIGDGIISDETKAIVAEMAAKNDVNEAETTVDSTEAAITVSLNDADEKLDTVSENVAIINEKMDVIETSVSGAEAAEVSTNNATTSTEAKEYAEVAKTNAETASNAAVSANEAAAAAKTAYEAAVAEYEQAVEAAKAAVDKANAAIEAGSEDAEEATALAKSALEKAEALKTEKTDAATAAGEEVLAAEKADNDADLALAAANASFLQKGLEEVKAISDAAITGVALAKANLALGAAKVFENWAEKNLEEKKQAVADLIQAKEDAEEALAEAEKSCNDALENKELTAKDAADYLKTLNSIKETLASLESSLSTAEADIEAKEAEAAEAETEYNNYVTSVSGNSVYELEKQLANATTDADKADIITKIETTVVTEQLGGKGKTVSFDSESGVWTVSENGTENAKYYKAEVENDGTIKIYEYDQIVTYKKVVDTVSSSDLASLEEGAVVVETVSANEALYTVTYKDIVTVSGTETTMKGSEFKSSFGDSVPDGAVVMVKDVTTIRGTKTLYYKYVSGKGWQAYYDSACTDKGSLGTMKDDDNVTVYYSENVYSATKTATNVKNSELSNYSSKKDYNADCTAVAVEAQYEVTYKTSTENVTIDDVNAAIEKYGEDLVEYTKTADEIKDGTVLKEAEEAEYTVTYTETTETSVKYARNAIDFSKVADEISKGYVFTVVYDGNTYTNITAITSEVEWFESHTYIYYTDAEGKTHKLRLDGDKAEGTSISGVLTTSETVTVNNVKESNLSSYSSNADYKAKETKAAVAAVYSNYVPAKYTLTIYKNVVDSVEYSLTDEDADASQINISGKVTSLSNASVSANEALAAARSNYNTVSANCASTKAEEEAAYAAYQKAKTTAEEAEADYNTKKDKYDKLKSEYDAYYTKKGDVEVLGVTIQGFGLTQYQKDLAAAELEVASAEATLIEAKAALKLAKDAQAAAKQAHEDATEALKSATKALASATADVATATTKKIATAADLAAKKTAKAVADAAADYASKLDTKAQAAYEAALDAEGSLNALKGKANVSASELKAAKNKLEALQAAYNAALAEAEKADTLAKEAMDSYEETLKKVAALEEEEAAAEAARLAALNNTGSGDNGGNTENGGSTDNVSTAEATLATANISDSPVPMSATVGEIETTSTYTVETSETEETADAADTVEITEEETPLADAADSDYDLTVIEDEDTPLASEATQEKMQWWWILIVLLLGTTGAELYRRHQVKKSAEKVEK